VSAYIISDSAQEEKWTDIVTITLNQKDDYRMVRAHGVFACHSMSVLYSYHYNQAWK